MILVVKGADFSANNIGKVEFATELTTATMDVMSKLTKYPAEKSNYHAQALDRMIRKLVDNGLWDGISMLSIPIMSADIEECSYNVKNGSYSSNVDKIYQLNSDNELYWPSYTSGYENKAFYPISLASNNMVLFGAMSVHSETYGQVIGLGDATGWFSTKGGIVVLKPQGLIVMCNSNVRVSEDRVAVTSAFVANCKGTDVLYIDSKGEYTGQSTTSEYKNYTQLYPALSAYNSGSTFSYKIFGCGIGFSKEQTKELYKILQEFVDAF